MKDAPRQTDMPVTGRQAEQEPTTPPRLKRAYGDATAAVPVAAAAAITSAAVIMAIRARQRRQARHGFRQTMQRAGSAASERLTAVGRVAARPIAARPDIAAEVAVGALTQILAVMARQGDTSRGRRRVSR